MHANILSLAAILLLATTVHADVTMCLYQDNNCQTLIPGSHQTIVDSGTCDENVSTGWSSAMIFDNSGSPACTLTFYNMNNCAAGQPGHGYSSANFACMINFGFIANTVGLAGDADMFKRELKRSFEAVTARYGSA